MLATDWFFVIFRLLHIVAGALWFGSAFLFVAIIGPSAAQVGPAAGPLLHVAVKEKKVSTVVTTLGIITVTAGWIMWIRHAVDAGLSDWITSSYGIALTMGGVLASISFYFGYAGVGKNVERLVDIGDTVAASGGPPSPEQASEIDRLQAALKSHGQIDLASLALAVAMMATAQYW